MKKHFKIFNVYYSGKETVKDVFGQTINRSDYKKSNLDTGWDIDHILPQKKGGSNECVNLIPLAISSNKNKASKTRNMKLKNGKKVSVVKQISKHGITYGIFKLENRNFFPNQSEITKKLLNHTIHKK